MKLSSLVSLLLVALIASVAATGCRKKPVGITKIPPGTTQGTPADIGTGEPLKLDGVGTGDPSQPDPLADPEVFKNYNRNEEIFKEDMVFFAYDSSVVRASEKPKVAKIAAYMKEHADHALEVDGHCDERGTEEYNRALGERRALAIRQELSALEVDAKRIITKSFGKDRPLVPLRSEAAWSKNRRGEFILLTPP